MAKNEVVVNVKANSSQFDQTITGIKKKLKDTFANPSSFSLNAISPWKIVADGIVSSIKYVWNTVRDFGKDMEAFGEKQRKAAESTGITSGEYRRLSDEARRAGISANAFADSMERVKNGEITVNELAESWARLGDAVSGASSKISSIGALRDYMKKHDSGELNLVQAIWANVNGDYQAAAALEKLTKQVYAGRKTLFSMEEVMDVVWGEGVRSRPWGENTVEDISAILGVLNKDITDRIRRDFNADKALEEEKLLAEKEAEKARKIEAAEEKKRQDALNAAAMAEVKAREELAKKIATAYESYKSANLSDEEARKAIMRDYDIGVIPEYSELLDLGWVLNDTGDARTRKRLATIEQEKRAKEEAEKEAAKEAEDARKREESERKQRESERDTLTKSHESLQKRIAETEGTLSASWLTSTGGSMLGGGGFTTAMAMRMRGIDKADKQQQIVDELKGVNEQLAAVNKALEE